MAALEDEAVRRAMKKWDALLMFVLRGWMPEIYGYRGQFEFSGPQGDPMEIVERLNAGRRMAAAKREEAE